MNPSVSVIIPTYNRKEMLEECLDAVLGQTRTPAEVIVLDDGSTDGSAEFVLAKYGSRVRLRRLGHSGLPAVARNRGIEIASGEFLAFCDSDDIWLPEKLERQLEWMKSRAVDVCSSDAFVHGSPGMLYLSRYHFVWPSLQQCLARENYVIASSVILKRTALGIHRFPEDPASRGYEDYLLWLELARHCNLGYLNEPLLWYRIHEKSLSIANKKKDSRVQLRIVFSGGILLRYPIIGVGKILRHIAILLLSFFQNRLHTFPRRRR